MILLAAKNEKRLFFYRWAGDRRAAQPGYANNNGRSEDLTNRRSRDKTTNVDGCHHFETRRSCIMLLAIPINRTAAAIGFAIWFYQVIVNKGLSLPRLLYYKRFSN